MGSTQGDMGVLGGVFGAFFGSFCGVFGAFLGHIWCNFVTFLGHFWGRFGGVLGAFWEWYLGRFWDILRAFLGCFGSFLGAFLGTFLGVLWHLYHLKEVARHASGDVSRITKFFGQNIILIALKVYPPAVSDPALRHFWYSNCPKIIFS